MASKLTKVIGVKNLDVIRAKIASILTDELANQGFLQSDDDFEINIGLERYTPINENEYPFITVRFVNAQLIAQDVLSSKYTYQFSIAFYTAKSEIDGDSNGALHVTKILGTCIEIFRSSAYTHLDLARPMIGKVTPSQMQVADLQDNQESLPVMAGALTLEIEAIETNNEIDPLVLQGYEATLKLFDSSRSIKLSWEKH